MTYATRRGRMNNQSVVKIPDFLYYARTMARDEIPLNSFRTARFSAFFGFYFHINYARARNPRPLVISQISLLEPPPKPWPNPITRFLSEFSASVFLVSAYAASNNVPEMQKISTGPGDGGNRREITFIDDKTAQSIARKLIQTKLAAAPTLP